MLLTRIIRFSEKKIVSASLARSRRLLSTTDSTVATTSKPATAAVTTSHGSPAAPVKKGGLRQSVAWFLAGCGLSLGLGYLQLSYDIETHTRGVEASLAELRRDTLDSQKALRKRLAELESKR
jgi:hypothetical protein